jgi:hypothetical protein
MHMIKKNLTLLSLVTVLLVAGTMVSCGDSATTETTVTSDTTKPVVVDTTTMPADTTTFTDSATTRPTKTPD